MSEVLFLTAYVLILAIPTVITAVIIAAMMRTTPFARCNPVRCTFIAGSIAPVMIVIYGLWLSWPWPWWQPDQRQDMIPPGSGLLFSSFPSWILSLTLSWLVLRRTTANGS
jgi:hypothetical protein